MSILCDYKLELTFEIDWQALGRPPVDYDECGYRFWTRVKAMHGESEYHRNSFSGD
jgi:hypothetical protein